MALDTYDNLQTSIAKWLWRTGETDTVAYIPDMITMAEASFNRLLRVREMDDVEASLAITNGVATAPTGLRAVKSFYLTGEPYNQILQKPIDQIERMDPNHTGEPCFYDKVGSQFIFWPRTTATASIRYTAEIPALTDDNTSNWLLAKHPDLYLFQSLAMGEAFNMNDSRIAIWKAQAMSMIEEINREDRSYNSDGIQMPAGVSAVI